MLSCKDLIEQVDDLLADDLPWCKRVSIRLHLAMCRHCRAYVAQYRRMIALLPRVRDRASDDEVAEIVRTVQGAAKDVPGE